MKALRIRKIMFIIGSLLLLSSPLAAFSPTFLLGSSAELITSSGSSNDLWWDLYGIGSWRTAFNSGSYLAIDGDLLVERLVSDSDKLQDEESLHAEYGLPMLGGRSVFETSLYSSLRDASDDSSLQSRWAAEHFFTGTKTEQGSRITPYIGYSGSYLYEDLKTRDRFSHIASLGVSIEPSILRQYRFELAAGTELWTEDYILDESGSATEELRKDLLADIEGEITGMIGYFTDWSTVINLGIRLSNDNRLTELGDVQAEASDFLHTEIEGAVSWGPSRSLQLSGQLYLEGQGYLERAALNPDGSIGSEALLTLNLGSSFSLDWSLNDDLFFTLSLSGGRTFSNEADYEVWNVSLSGGIEYGF